MSRTLEEIKEYLIQHYDPDDLIEAFEISTEELIDRFEDKVLYYSSKFEETQEEEEEEYL